MKRLSLYLFLILFTLQTPSQADDIRDFQIEGMSLGDSLLDYFSEEEIQKNTDNFKYSNNDFVPVTIKGGWKVYDSVQFYYKNYDEKKPIHMVNGTIFFKDNIKECYVKEKEIINELKNIFPNTKQVNLGKIKLPYDKSGKSTKTNYRFVFNDENYAFVACYDWSKKMKYWDHLRVGVVAKDFDYWIYNVASK